MSTKTYVVGTQKNILNVHLKQMSKLMDKKIYKFYAQNFCPSGSLIIEHGLPVTVDSCILWSAQTSSTAFLTFTSMVMGITVTCCK